MNKGRQAGRWLRRNQKYCILSGSRRSRLSLESRRCGLNVSRCTLSGFAIALAAALTGGIGLAGCGLPAAPQPPSLKLPAQVTDLSATRTGSQVSLTWTMPKRDTNKVLLKGKVATRVCRRGNTAEVCATVARLELGPGADGAFMETLPRDLTAGAPRALDYFVELINRRGRSAGLSNPATVLAGEAPAAVEGLSAEVRKEGVALHWTVGPPEPYPTVVRLERTLETPPAKKAAPGPLAAPAEPVEQNLLVQPAAGQLHGGALDKDIRFGETYAYRAARVARLAVGGKTLDLDGPISAPVQVEALDVFPPAVPVGLAAVATPAEDGVSRSIDLSWQPDAESDVAGYAVYRREIAATRVTEGAWHRISPAALVVGPGFHDPNVQEGHSYEYVVTAIGQNGRESERSAPAQESVPEP